MILNKKDRKLFLPLPPDLVFNLCFIFQDDIEQEGQKAVPSVTPLIWSAACVCSIFQDDIEQEGQEAVPSVTPRSGLQFGLFSRMILNKKDRKLFLPLPPDLVFSLVYFPGWYWTRRTESCSFRYPPIWSSVWFIFQDDIEQEGQKAVPSDTPLIWSAACVCFIFQDDIEQEGQKAVPSVTSPPPPPHPPPWSGLQPVCVLFSRMILNKKDRKLFLPLPPQSGLQPVFVLFSRMILNKKDRKLFLPLPPWSGLQPVCVLFSRMILNKKDRKLFLPLPPWFGLQPVFYFPGWYWTRRTESCSFRYLPDLVCSLCSIFQDDIEQEGQKAVPSVTSLIWSAACVCSIFQDDIEQGQKAVPSVTPHPTPQSGLQPVFYFPGWYWTRRTESCSFRYTPPNPPIWSAACVLFSRMILNKDRKLFLPLPPPDLVFNLCFIFQDDIEQEGQEAEEGVRVPPRPVHHGNPCVCVRAVRPALDVRCHRADDRARLGPQRHESNPRPRREAQTAGSHRAASDQHRRQLVNRWVQTNMSYFSAYKIQISLRSSTIQHELLLGLLNSNFTT